MSEVEESKAALVAVLRENAVSAARDIVEALDEAPTVEDAHRFLVWYFRGFPEAARETFREMTRIEVAKLCGESSAAVEYFTATNEAMLHELLLKLTKGA